MSFIESAHVVTKSPSSVFFNVVLAALFFVLFFACLLPAVPLVLTVKPNLPLLYDPYFWLKTLPFQKDMSLFFFFFFKVLMYSSL